MNKYFKLLSYSVLSCIAGLAVSIINPVVLGVLVASAGIIVSGYYFIKED